MFVVVGMILDILACPIVCVSGAISGMCCRMCKGSEAAEE